MVGGAERSGGAPLNLARHSCERGNPVATSPPSASRA